jgi:hypothetical protein
MEQARKRVRRAAAGGDTTRFADGLDYVALTEQMHQIVAKT